MFLFKTLQEFKLSKYDPNSALKYSLWVAAIAPWFRLRLPSCVPGFDSQALHLRFFQFVLLKLYRENNENKQKEAGIGPFKKNIVIFKPKILQDWSHMFSR